MNTLTVLTPEVLNKALLNQFPIDTVSWAVATDEVRDMSRAARELLLLDDSHAINFREIRSPSEWNQRGIESIVNWYTQMDDALRGAFCREFQHWLDEWTEP